MVSRPQPRPTQRSASGLSSPQNWSLSGGAASAPSRQGQNGPMLAMNMGPAINGPQVPGPRISGADLGSDWVSLYEAWVRSHLYYPDQAAMNNEEGSVTVVLKIDRSGRVLSVELTDRSGSQWLDLASAALFRNARVPAFPANVTGDSATVQQTIHYMLIRHR